MDGWPLYAWVVNCCHLPGVDGICAACCAAAPIASPVRYPAGAVRSAL